jgi:hypothetical protein
MTIRANTATTTIVTTTGRDKGILTVRKRQGWKREPRNTAVVMYLDTISRISRIAGLAGLVERTVGLVGLVGLVG